MTTGSPSRSPSTIMIPCPSGRLQAVSTKRSSCVSRVVETAWSKRVEELLFRAACPTSSSHDSPLTTLRSSSATLKAPDSIRLAPSIPGMRGSIWSTIPNPHPEWEVIFSIKITGTHVGGGRGIAFWYTKERARIGPVFGNADGWDGVGVLLDSTGTQERVGVGKGW
ncbi:concanavalin A-like lectin/glucanase domain-containing protein [Endogone sp. FLAS-F59071]|nr:concanavalin A-like lectin/glucanase domain-containing protein [Endogone sp. FLAS-F59071]|eukprot:RUS14309.1 concanavalin A-like lectin/glucanase domain-containing protein [Endogone sp. FLAS-F59071]